MTFLVGTLASPIGEMVVAVRDAQISVLCFAAQWPRQRERLEKRFGRVEYHPAADPADVITRLREYFTGNLDALASIATDTGGTPFQRRVWDELRKIPAGRTVSYGNIALAIGAPTAVRAVGAANGANPVAIVIPCHRVIGANGQLTGYGGGIERKRWLLAHESGQHALRIAEQACSSRDFPSGS